MSKLKIAITGASGMVGSYLSEFLIKAGHTVSRLVRSTSTPSNSNCIQWNPEAGTIDLEKLEGHDALVHLAGASIAGRRWSRQYKDVIFKSRIQGTSFACEVLGKLKRPPKNFLCASAVGFYGNRPGAKLIDEKSLPGTGFLSHVCEEWEKIAINAQTFGVRVVCMRFGMILSSKGGALAQMLPIFKWGLGGKLGKGQQMISWISLPEIPSVVLHLIHHTEISGAVNVVSPKAVENKEFTQILGKVLKRPAIFPVPSSGVKLLFGEMGEELLLSGARVIPRRLQDSGYEFIYPDLEKALENLLKKEES